MKIFTYIVLFFSILLTSCANNKEEINVRRWKDSTGFAVYAWQMDSIMNRLAFKEAESQASKVLISPHDDYKYVGSLYPEVLSTVKANKLIIFGVAHRAAQFGNQDQFVFGSFKYWNSAYGNIKVWDIQEKLLKEMNPSTYIINDSLMEMEHSIEALLPYLQYFNGNIEILPILVPYNSFDNLNRISKNFSKILFNQLEKKKLDWGDDFAIIISNDAIHYGNEDWGGKDMAPFGVDSLGYNKVLEHENLIIETSLIYYVDTVKIKKFMSYTTMEDDYMEYKWTWCGRYSIPAGLLTSYWLSQQYGFNLFGELIDYSTSIENEKIMVEDLDLGVTAPANLNHWVGYAGIKYK